MLTTVGVVVLSLVVGAFLGLLTAWPAWTREARQRYIEAMVARGEIERQANRISFLEGRIRERDSELKDLQSELQAKDLLTDGLKIGMVQLRDRVSDLERELSQANVPFLGNGGDGTVERLRERVAELEPLMVQLAERDVRIRRLEGLAAEAATWEERLEAAHAEYRELVASKDRELEELHARIADLEPLVEQLAQRDKALEQIASLKAELESRELRIQRLAQEHQGTVAHKDARIESFRRRLAVLEPLVARLAEREEQVEELTARLREQSDEQRRVEQEHRLRIETQEAQIEALQDRLGELEPLRQRIADREERIQELEFLEKQLAEFESMEQRLREREARVSELERQDKARTSDSGQEIQRLRMRIGELAPLGERLRRRSERIHELEVALEAQQGDTVRARKEGETRVAEAIAVKTEEIEGLKQQVQTLEAQRVGADRQTTTADELRQRLQDLEEQYAQTIEERDELLRAGQEQARESEDLRAEFAALRAEHKATLQRRTRELARLRRRVSQMQPRARRSRASGGPSQALSRSAKDNLKRIRGIGPALERKLNSIGCLTFDDIARWTADDIVEVAREVRIPPRRIRDEWLKQARVYARQRPESVQT